MDDRKLSRRRFLKGAGGLSVGAIAAGLRPLGLPSAHADSDLPEAVRSLVPPLSDPIETLESTYDTVVIGSGYGASVLAARLAGKRKLCVLERGKEWLPGDFPANLLSAGTAVRTSKTPLGLYDFHFGSTVDVFVGCGLGGTSLINANVSIAPTADVFNRPEWPQAIRDAYAHGDFTKACATAQTMLSVQSSELAQPLGRAPVYEKMTGGTQGKFLYADLMVNFGQAGAPNPAGIDQPVCSLCANCVTGCNSGAKNTLNMNYLPFAKSNGAKIFTQIEVDAISKNADGSYDVSYVYHSSDCDSSRGAIRCKEVVVGAGVLGSTGILLRSQATGGIALSPMLGKRFSANGDYLGMSYDGNDRTDDLGILQKNAQPSSGSPRVGPTITMIGDYRGTSASASNNPSDQFIIEDGAIPYMMAGMLAVGMATMTLTSEAGDLSRRLLDLFGASASGALDHSMILLGMGYDGSGGEIVLNSGGQPQVNWTGVQDVPGFNAIKSKMSEQAQAAGGTFQEPNPRTTVLGGALMTVHPLGGCPMGDSAQTGVVDAHGRVFDPSSGGVHDGLYIVDGSIIPTSLGVNPSLTITALAELIASTIK